MNEPNDAKMWTPDQLVFQAWLALPSAARSPKQQQQLAKQLGHDPATLSDWKRLPGFQDAVYAMALDVVKGELAPILHAHAKRAHVDLDSAKWVFEIVGKWTPTTRQQHGNVPGEPFQIGVKAVDYREGLSALRPPDAADE